MPKKDKTYKKNEDGTYEESYSDAQTITMEEVDAQIAYYADGLAKYQALKATLEAL